MTTNDGRLCHPRGRKLRLGSVRFFTPFTARQHEIRHNALACARQFRGSILRYKRLSPRNVDSQRIALFFSRLSHTQTFAYRVHRSTRHRSIDGVHWTLSRRSGLAAYHQRPANYCRSSLYISEPGCWHGSTYCRHQPSSEAKDATIVSQTDFCWV